MTPRKPLYKVVGPLKRHDQRNTVWIKGFVDDEYQSSQTFMGSKKFWEKIENDIRVKKPGYGLEDYAFWHATWHLAHGLGDVADNAGNELYYSWKSPKPMKLGKLEVSDPAEMSRKVKKVAKFIGADLVGICRLNRDWVYSHAYDYPTRTSKEIVFEDVDEPEIKEDKHVIPNKVRYAVVLGTAKDFLTVATSPSPISGAATGMAYSRMVLLASTLAEFIRGLGYVAIPCGNDTALSIPLAVDAGLGELGRNGLLITPEFGPRLRLCKVLTDLPLQPDEPVDSGIKDFCSTCLACAKNCPAKAISYDEMTSEGPTEENNPGVMKWYINPEKCHEFHATKGAPGCLNCIMSCPFNTPSPEDTKKPGYAKRIRPESWWKT